MKAFYEKQHSGQNVSFTQLFPEPGFVIELSNEFFY